MIMWNKDRTGEMKKYNISYTYQRPDGGGLGLGSVTVTTNRKIYKDDLENIRKQIIELDKKNRKEVVILNVQRFPI